MELGLLTKMFARPTIEEVFDALAAHSMHHAQLNFASAGLPSLPDGIDTSLLDRIRRAAKEHRIAIDAVSGTFNMIHPDPKQRRDGLQRFEVIAAAAARLNSPIITLCTGTRDPEDIWRRHDENDWPEAWRDLIETLTNALSIADRHGLTLGVEPEIGNVIDSSGKARRLLDEVRTPRLKIIMDAANLFHPGDLPRMKEVLDEAFDLLGGDIILAHAKELRRDGHAGGLPPGAGILDWDHYLSLLRRANFSGPLIMHGFEEADAFASTEFLRHKLTALERR